VSTPLVTQYGPCDPWPVRWICDTSDEQVDEVDQAVQFATEVVWALSGRQFGLCTVTLRPCRRDCFDSLWFDRWLEWPIGATWPSPHLIGGRWFNLVCGRCGDACSCTALSEVALPGPVHSVIEVKVDGSPLVTGAYRLDDARTLVRVDGGEWPRCNDLNQDDDAVDTWSVTARFGTDVPEGGAWAVGELACQFIAARHGGDCRLPRSVTQLVRQGVTIQFGAVLELLREGLTGLHLVDLFIRTWNPNRLARRNRTYSVDGPQHRRVNT
jgi:hypothetical protein